MRKLIFLLILGVASGIGMPAVCMAGPDKEENKELMNQANDIKNALNLNDDSKKLVYNVLVHVESRIADLPLGTPNYERLIKYIDEEREEMMKVILPKNSYNIYDRLYSPAAKKRVAELIEKSKRAPSIANTPKHVDYVGGLEPTYQTESTDE